MIERYILGGFNMKVPMLNLSSTRLNWILKISWVTMKSRCHELNFETKNYYDVNLAFFNNWHHSTIGATEEKAITNRRKKKLGLHLFTYSTAAIPNVFRREG